MAASQTILFTALPRAVSLNADTLPVSVFISPRLSGEEKLGAYPDWQFWTERRRDGELLITFECAGQTLTLDAPRGELRPKLWTALFNDGTYVRSHQFNDYSDRFIASYPVRWGLSALKSTYQAAGVALALPESGDPREQGQRRRQILRSLIRGYEVNWDQATGRRWREEQRTRQRDSEATKLTFSRTGVLTAGQLGSDGLLKTGLIEPGSEQSKRVHSSVVEPFAVFNHQPAGAPVTRESLDEKTVLDFHQALSSLNTYPELQRWLGLVFDLELPADFVTETPGETSGELRIVQVEAGWDSSTETKIPVTSTAYVHGLTDSGRIFATAPRNLKRPGLFGLLDLDPLRFGLAQVDVDGGLHKTIILAETMAQPDHRGPSQPQHPEVYDPTTALPSLRSGGLSLYADRRALSLLQTFDDSKKFNQALENQQPQPRPFYAEDLVRGYRLDVWDGVTGGWHSLHRRKGTYQIGEHVETTEDEEGFIQLAATQAAPEADGSRASDDLNLHEALARWNGWSLSVDRPGKHLTRAADPDQAVPDPDQPDPENEPITPFNMTATYGIVTGSLPRLRFGSSYRLRARAVDLAGNSLKLADPLSELLSPRFSLPREGVFPYLRFEPVAAPFLVLLDELGVSGRGSAVDRLVIRTFNSDPSMDGAAADRTAADRHIAPPRGSVELGERHGLFDDASGKLNPSPAMWQLIKTRDEGNFNTVEVDSLVIAGEKQKVPLEPAPRLDALPYLPDPLARGAAFRDLPGTEAGSLARLEPGAGPAGPVAYEPVGGPNPRPGSATLVGFGGREDWQVAAPFRLALDEGSRLPEWDPAERLLTVFLPKGLTKTIPLSSYVDPEDLKVMGVWQWLREYFEYITTEAPETEFYRSFGDKDHIAHLMQLAIEGGHWMLTPPLLLTLVHAVQQPLGRPAFTRLMAQLDPASGSPLLTMPELPPTGATELEAVSSWRALGSTDAYLVGALNIHGASTAKIDLQATWTDPVDDPAADGPGEQAFSAPVDEVPLNTLLEDMLIANQAGWRPVGYYDPEHDLVCFAPRGARLGNLAQGAALWADAAPRHQIGDTKHHVIEYTAVATSRYREYFPEQQDGADLDFTRSSDPVTVHVPASARPLAPQVLYVVPTFGWQREDETNQKRSLRMGGGLRIYLDRGWWSSGVDELLGVAVAPYGEVIDREEWKPFITQWGQDPIWESALLPDFPRSSNFPEAVIHEGSLPLAARKPAGKLELGERRRVGVAGHKVDYDDTRKLWYCDLTVDTQTATYAPFVRLALVRYQPYALEEAKLSRTVLADFAQLTPERAALVTADPYAPGRLRVVISGPAPRGPRPQSHGTPRPTTPVARPTLIRVTVQERDPAVQSDLGWRPATVVSGALATLVCGGSRAAEQAWDAQPAGTFAVCVKTQGTSPNDLDLALWDGVVRFRPPLQANQYRLLIEEFEYLSADYTVVTTEGRRRRVEQPGRLIYAETILLDDALLAGPAVQAGKTTVEE